MIGSVCIIKLVYVKQRLLSPDEWVLITHITDPAVMLQSYLSLNHLVVSLCTWVLMDK